MNSQTYERIANTLNIDFADHIVIKNSERIKRHTGIFLPPSRFRSKTPSRFRTWSQRIAPAQPGGILLHGSFIMLSMDDCKTIT